MKKINLTLLMLCIVSAVFCAEPIIAQQNISPEKKAAIEEIRELTGVKRLSVKTGLDSTNIGDAVKSFVDNKSG